MRILIIEDDDRLARVMERVLRQERFEVDVAHDGESGLEQALSGIYDALIVDWMLPKQDGVALIRELRSERIATPVIMLTARGELPERVQGLDAGADDYLGKPFAFEELLARLRALTRRGERPLLDPTITIGDVTIDVASRTVSRRGQPIELSPREFAVLETLARNRGRVLSRDQLLERVWGYDADPQGNVVDLYIYYLRRKLDPDGRSIKPLIRTVRGSGYLIPGP
jgi:DNA-binding response OmpR family regulator